MATFTVDVDYIINSTEISQDQVAVTFTLTCTEASLDREYTEVYPQAMYYQNIDPTMDEFDLQTQMRANFLILARMTIEDFASEAKAIVQKDQGSTVDVDLSGTIALSTTNVYVTFGLNLNSFTVVWS
jgi:hypothetical protein